MKVLLIEPPRKVWELMGNCVAPPLGLAQIAAVLEERGIPVRIVDCNASGLSWARLKRAIAREEPDLVGASAMTPFFPDVYRVTRIAKGVNPRIITVLGGPHVTFTPGRPSSSAPRWTSSCGARRRGSTGRRASGLATTASMWTATTCWPSPRASWSGPEGQLVLPGPGRSPGPLPGPPAPDAPRGQPHGADRHRGLHRRGAGRMEQPPQRGLLGCLGVPQGLVPGSQKGLQLPDPLRHPSLLHLVHPPSRAKSTRSSSFSLSIPFIS
ncbi:MAG TPA: cobalamin B12-binding domain-containing protein [Anaerolineae bacterium]|nr:cobalamin B12-binding domain-containing protein [Anaerolineae bacterium]